MREGERDLLLILLAAAAGASDAWSYLGLGHAFVANMTGNTVLIGLAVFTRHDLLSPCIALGCYAAGTAVGAFLTRGLKKDVVWGRAVSLTLLVEAIALVACEATWVRVRATAGDPHYLLLGFLGCAVGLQSAAMLQLRIPGIVTTYITGTWTTLVSGIATFASRERGRPQRERAAFEERLLLQLGIVATYLGAAVLTGWLSQRAPMAMGLLPAVTVLFAALFGLARG